MEVTSPTVAWARVVKKGEGRKEIMPSGIDKEERSFPTIKKVEAQSENLAIRKRHKVVKVHVP